MLKWSRNKSIFTIIDMLMNAEYKPWVVFISKFFLRYKKKEIKIFSTADNLSAVDFIGVEAECKIFTVRLYWAKY